MCLLLREHLRQTRRKGGREGGSRQENDLRAKFSWRRRVGGWDPPPAPAPAHNKAMMLRNDSNGEECGRLPISRSAPYVRGVWRVCGCVPEKHQFRSPEGACTLYDVCRWRGGTPKADAVRKLSKGGCVKMQTRGGGSQNIRKFADVICTWPAP